MLSLELYLIFLEDKVKGAAILCLYYSTVYQNVNGYISCILNRYCTRVRNIRT